MNSGLRRRALGIVGAVVTTLAIASFAGCGSAQPEADGESSDGTANYGSVTEQLSWFKNIEFAGEYFGIENGYFKDAGFSDVKLVAGGPTVPPAETALASGSAWIGRTSPLLTASANAEGGDYRIVAVLYQKNPYTLTYKTTNPISSPKDLIGKKVGVPDAAIVPWRIFLAANGIEENQVTRVPSTGTDAESQLAGDVSAVLTYQYGTKLQKQGKTDYKDYVLDDHGLKLGGEALVVSKKTIDSERDKVKAFLTAFIKGWNDAQKDPEQSVALAVDQYGKDAGLEKADQDISFAIQTESVVTPDTLANGLGTLTPELLDANITSLNLGGFKITADDLFDLSIINEIYKESPDLKYQQ